MQIWNLPLLEFTPFDELVEPNPIALVTTPDAWEAVADDLHTLNITWRADITEATAPHWMTLAADLLAKLSNYQLPITIYSVGSGLAADAAKYLAHHTKLALVCLPTTLSEDVFLTPTSSVRHDGMTHYLETKPSERVIIDFDVLAAAPRHLRAAGICDVLSISTALWDWETAEEQGKNPEGMELVPWAADAAQAILQGALDCAEAAGEGDPAGLKQLLDCLAMEVQLCNLLGHARLAEGSEHYFAYAVENHLSPGHSHGELVAAGVLLMAEKQDQDVDELRYALEACHIPLDAIPKDVIESTLRELPEYVRKHELPYGIAHELSNS
jgi:glycerol-1-phosphate dehydrogenase [NAD(P)+]